MLKLLKNAKVLIDCETKQFHIDTGSECIPVGGGPGGMKVANLEVELSTLGFDADAIFDAVYNGDTHEVSQTVSYDPKVFDGVVSRLANALAVYRGMVSLARYHPNDECFECYFQSFYRDGDYMYFEEYNLNFARSADDPGVVRLNMYMIPAKSPCTD